MRLFPFAGIRCAFSIAGPFLDAPGGGGGGGASANASGDRAGAGAPASGASGGGQPSGAGAAGTAAGTGGAAPFRLSDDAQVDLGDGRVGRWGELRSSHYVDRANYDRGVTYLNSIAANLDAREQQLLERITAAQRGQRPDGSPNPQTDPFAELEGIPLVDGKTLAKYARDLTTNGFGKLAQTMTSLADRLRKIEEGQGQLGAVAGRQTEREAEEHFGRFVTEALTKTGPIKGLPEGLSLPTDSPFLNAVARDVWSSHDPSSWKSPAEFHKVLGERIAASIAFVRDLDKQAIKAGEEKRRSFLNPKRGNGTPKGEAPYRHLRGDDLGKMLFHGGDGRT